MLKVRSAVGIAVLCLAHTAVAENVFMNVPEAAGYTLVYSLSIPNSASFSSSGVPYSVDNSTAITPGSFNRIAYYLELQSGSGTPQWVYVSVDSFVDSAALIGVPTSASGEFYQMDLSGMDIYSDVPGIVTGTGLSTGNIEFWPSNYSPSNSAGVPNASSGTYDWGDGGASTSTGYGSMQIANYGSSQMLFSFNDWNSGIPDLGIGNQPTGSPDWTFAHDAGSYTVKNLDILVEMDTPEPATALYAGSGLLLAAFILRRIRRTANAPSAER